MYKKIRTLIVILLGFLNLGLGITEKADAASSSSDVQLGDSPFMFLENM